MARRKVQSITQKKSRITGKIIYFFTLLIFIGAVIYLLFFSGLLNIITINVHGADTLGDDVIGEKIEAQLNGKYLGLIDRRNTLLFSQGKTEKLLSQDFKKIESIEITRKSPSAIEVTVKERQIVMAIASENKLVAVDENRVAFEETDLSQLPADIPVVADNSNHELDLNEIAIDEGYVDFILNIRERLKDACDLEVDRNVETPSLVAPDIRMTTTEGWKLYFSREVPAEKEVDMLKVVLDQKIDKDKRANLDYIDLRVDNKVFYKFKDGSSQSEETQVQGAEDQKNTDSSKDSKSEKKKKKKKNH